MPIRVKVEGDRFHPRVPEGAIYVGRAGPHLKRSPWHNPFSLRDHSRDQALALYREHLRDHPDLVTSARAELAGQDLACRCDLDLPCHADILLAVIAGEDP